MGGSGSRRPWWPGSSRSSRLARAGCWPMAEYLAFQGWGWRWCCPSSSWPSSPSALQAGGRLSRGLRCSALIGVNVVRVLGVEFLLLQAAGRLPAPFAPAAGWGDVAVGAAAPLVAWMVARDWKGSRGVALAWTALGFLDLVDAIGLGVTSSPGPLRVFVGDPSSAIMSEIPWILIPCFLVPLFVFTHLAVFARLGGWRQAQRGAAPVSV